MNALLIYPEFPDTFWSFKYALPFAGKREACGVDRVHRGVQPRNPHGGGHWMVNCTLLSMMPAPMA